MSDDKFQISLRENGEHSFKRSLESYEVAIERVEAFLNPQELSKTLRDQLDELNRVRNQLEHYAIDADRS
jgi:hypothetical protein